MVRVVVMASSLAVRAGLRALLEAGGEIDVVGQVSSPSELQPVLPVADVLVMAGEPSPSAELEEYLATDRRIGLLLLVEEDSEHVSGYFGLAASAIGVLPLDSSPEELEAAVIAIHNGLIVGKPEIVLPMLAQRRSHGERDDLPMVEPLTEREHQILQLLYQGLANKQIAVQLGISEHTVKFHVSGIYAKLEATNRTEAVRLGIHRGLIAL